MEIIDEGKANRHVAVTSKFLLATRDLQLDSPNDSNALPVRLVLRITTIISLSCTMSQLISRRIAPAQAYKPISHIQLKHFRYYGLY